MWAEALWKRDLTFRELAAYDADATDLARMGDSLELLGGKRALEPRWDSLRQSNVVLFCILNKFLI